MAKTVLGPNTELTVNAIDLSDHVVNATVENAFEEVDVTGFKEAYREFLPGLGDATITVTFLQDVAASSVDATLWPMFSNKTTGTVKVKADTTGTVVYTLIAKMYSYPPVSGGVGDANTIDVTFRNAGTAGLTRGTS